jgi:hypothetical protein
MPSDLEPSATCTAALEIVRRAADYDSATHIQVGVLPFGDSVIHNAAPYGPAVNEVRYKISFTAPADYGLYIEYAALDPRPCVVKWDDFPIASATLGRTTGGWEEKYQSWHKEGVVSGAAGVHELVIRREDVFPHIRSIKLQRENPAP